MKNNITISYFGTSLGYSLSLFFIPLIIYQITESALMVSISYVLDVIPYIVITPIIGVLGDKYNKKNIIMFGEICCLLSSVILFITPYNIDNQYQIILLGFIISAFSAAHHPIFQSILPDLFAVNKLSSINGSIASITSFTGIIAPSIIAILMPLVDQKTIPLIMITCYILSVLSFWKIKYNHTESILNGDFYHSVKQGILFINEQYTLKNLSYLFFFANFGLKVVFVNLIWIYSSRFDLESHHIAIIFSFIGVMSMVGAKLSAKNIVGKFKDVNVILGSLFFISILTLSNVFYSNYIYLTISWGIVSFLSMSIVVTYFTYRQVITPKEILSRVISMTRLISYLAIPPAAILSGYIAEHYGNERLLYLMSGLIMLIACFFFYFRFKQEK